MQVSFLRPRQTRSRTIGPRVKPPGADSAPACALINVSALGVFTSYAQENSFPEGRYIYRNKDAYVDPFTVLDVEPPKQSDISDGLSQTFMVFEDAGRPERYEEGAWTPPSNGRYPARNEHWADPENRITIQALCRGNQVVNCNNGNDIYSFHLGNGANYCFGDG